ncbi:hypothetical protein FAIPA1_40205 [Frankia sp. AiPs1]|uniref:hypothetical protein n=1 Tax=Frankia sp. AiPa1 TaxID=573492 RepID=UPI00202AD65D|nr:hypothetical protein [Frankia sp. AiPa1]MCL9758373.1 hypothetical protein [Frankia sp. AiPa1]
MSPGPPSQPRTTQPRTTQPRTTDPRTTDPQTTGRWSAEPREAAGFERLRRREYRAPGATAAPSGPAVGRDAHGKRMLYSGVRPMPASGAGLTVECSRCGGNRMLGAWQSFRVLTPSVHFPMVRSRHFSLVRCPNCHRVSWVRLGLHLRAAG